MRRVFIFLLTFVFTFLSTTGTYATSLDELRKKQQENNSAAEAAKTELENAKNARVEVFSEIDNIDFELNKASNELIEINNELEATTNELETVQKELDQAVQTRENQVELFEERLVFMYVYGKKGYLEILLDSNSFSDFFARLLYMDNIIKFDQNLIKEMTEIQNSIQEKRNTILLKREQIEKIANEQSRAMLALEETLKEKRELFNRLQADEERFTAYLAEVERSNAELDNLIRQRQLEQARLDLNNTYTGSGQLLWPVPASRRISSPYGNRVLFGRAEFHTGVDISASTGTPIVAADSGTVIYSGWQNGFGNTVVISHGNGMSTLYGHSSKLHVQVGDNVAKGQHIANVGSTGFSTGPHLHFEVRISNSHKNPMNYL